jgi:WD40 repeat protein
MAAAAVLVTGVLVARRDNRNGVQVGNNAPTTTPVATTALPSAANSTATTAGPSTTTVPTSTTVVGGLNLPPISSITAAGAQAFDDDGKPTWLTIAGDSVWILHEDGQIVRRDKHTGEVKGTVRVAKVGSYAESRPVSAFGSLWVAGSDSVLTRIDAATGDVTASIAIPDGLSLFVPIIADLAVAPDALWTLSGGENRRLLRIDPVTNNVTSLAVSNDPISPVNVGYSAGSLWVLYQGSDVMKRLNPADGAEIASIPLTFSPWTVVFDQTSGWVADTDGRKLAHIDPARNEVVATIATTDGQAFGVAVGFGGGYVWANAMPEALLAKIDPKTDTIVARYQEKSYERGLAADDEAVWVSSRADKKLYRLPLT